MSLLHTHNNYNYNNNNTNINAIRVTSILYIMHNAVAGHWSEDKSILL